MRFLRKPSLRNCASEGEAAVKTIYLLRHAAPDFPGGVKRCIGRTDLPLSLLGRMQCVLLGEGFRGGALDAVWHSGMHRTRETARALSLCPREDRALREIDVGAWEGKTFQEIRAQYPALYAARGRDPYRCRIPGGEAPARCLERMRAAFGRITAGIPENSAAAIVAHKSANQLLLCALLQRPAETYLTLPQPCGCVNVIRCEGDACHVECVGVSCTPPLSGAVAEQLYQAADLPGAIRAHCRRVADKAVELARRFPVDRDRLYAAALLHDICRREPDHARRGAQLLTDLGYPETGALIRSHHDLDAPADTVTEAGLLFLADKLILGDREVSLEERFAASREKISGEEALEAHARRYRQAKRLWRMICGGEAET